MTDPSGAELVGAVAQKREISSEILATRRELEKLAAGKRDVSVLRGWRGEVIGPELLATLGAA